MDRDTHHHGRQQNSNRVGVVRTVLHPVLDRCAGPLRVRSMEHKQCSTRIAIGFRNPITLSYHVLCRSAIHLFLESETINRLFCVIVVCLATLPTTISLGQAPFFYTYSGHGTFPNISESNTPDGWDLDVTFQIATGTTFSSFGIRPSSPNTRIRSVHLYAFGGNSQSYCALGISGISGINGTSYISRVGDLYGTGPKPIIVSCFDVG